MQSSGAAPPPQSDSSSTQSSCSSTDPSSVLVSSSSAEPVFRQLERKYKVPPPPPTARPSRRKVKPIDENDPLFEDVIDFAAVDAFSCSSCSQPATCADPSLCDSAASPASLASPPWLKLVEPVPVDPLNLSPLLSPSVRVFSIRGAPGKHARTFHFGSFTAVLCCAAVNFAFIV